MSSLNNFNLDFNKHENNNLTPILIEENNHSTESIGTIAVGGKRKHEAEPGSLDDGQSELKVRKVTQLEEPFLLQVSEELQIEIEKTTAVSLRFIGKVWQQERFNQRNLCIRSGFSPGSNKKVTDGPKFIITSEKELQCDIYATVDNHEYRYPFPCEERKVTDETTKIFYQYIDVHLSKLKGKMVEFEDPNKESIEGHYSDKIHFHLKSGNSDTCLSSLGSFFVRHHRRCLKSKKELEQPETFIPLVQHTMSFLPSALITALDFNQYVKQREFQSVPFKNVKLITEAFGAEFFSSWFADSLRATEPLFPRFEGKVEKVIKNFNTLASKDPGEWVIETDVQNIILSEEYMFLDPLLSDNPFRSSVVKTANSVAGSDTNRILFGDARMYTRHKNSDCCPAEAWFKGGANLSLVRNAILEKTKWFLKNKKGHDFTSKKLRSCIQKQFCPTGQYSAADTLAIMNQIEKTFDVTFRRILDPCAGFFGRGIGFMSLGAGANQRDGVVYIGVDPNKNIPYQEAIDTLNKHTIAKANVIQLPFEDNETLVEISQQLRDFGIKNENAENIFDYVFTSPPFFNIEHYSDDETQSSVRYPKYDLWLDNFFYPMFRRASDCLKPGGFLAIHLKGNKDYHICDDMNKYLNEQQPELEYIGAIPQHSTRRPPRGVKGYLVDFAWVYRKKEN